MKNANATVQNEIPVGGTPPDAKPAQPAAKKEEGESYGSMFGRLANSVGEGLVVIGVGNATIIIGVLVATASGLSWVTVTAIALGVGLLLKVGGTQLYARSNGLEIGLWDSVFAS